MKPVCLLALLAASLIAQTPEAPGRVVRVTLYRGQARVTRAIPLPARTGVLEVLVPDLPASVVPDSLYAEAEEGTDVRAVRFRMRAVGEEPHEEVRALDRQLAELSDAIAANQAGQQLARQRFASLDRLEAFVTPTAHGDLAKGVLDPEALERLILFNLKQRQEVQDRLLELQREDRKNAESLALLKRKRAELTATTAKTVREAVIFVEKRRGGASSLDLNYLVSGCGWTPAYNLRANREKGVVQVDYHAVIQQTTGEDWSGVDLTLSTATPALSAAGPGLAPFTVALAGGGREGKKVRSKEQASAALRSIAQEKRVANVRLQSAVGLVDNLDSALAVNRAADQLQTFEITVGNKLLATVTAEPEGASEGPSLSYVLGVPVSLASRADQQMVRITRADLKASFYHVATPVLTSLVHREARMTNTSGHDLLTGPVSVYLEGRFVGRAEMATVARGESFVMGFGADPRLRARRELADKREKTQGGNRVLSMDVRLEVENFHPGKVAIRILDRLPHSARKSDLRLTLGKSSHALSKDALYVRTDRPLGILRWDLEVPSGAIQEKALVVTYSYSMEFDRNFSLHALGQQQDGRYRQEFERLLKQRGQR